MNFNNKKVLIVPLDWGLGHATRCIPVVKAFLRLGWEVMIAADGAGESLLKQEFPQLQFLKLKGYNVEYSTSKWTLPLKLAVQVPKILSAIKNENAWLQRIIDQYNINLVISDNRYGLYTEKVPCIFITHQLQIKAPYRWIENKIRQLNFKYISRFTECWVPDAEVNSLAGELSHPDELHPFPLRYIGPLARFKKQMAALRYKYAFVISGPEPQRSLLEKMILKDINQVKDDVLIVRGKPGVTEKLSVPQNVTIVNHLSGNDLEKALNSAEYIISRSGYTTVMEIAALQKQAILIPTPGQTEQEYLASYLMEQGLAYSTAQSNFNLLQTLEAASSFHFKSFAVTPNMLEAVLNDFLSRNFTTETESSFAAS
jgi:uncharacterized protein (TIGR00661 family)